jgi:hypothetical protein
MDLDLEKYHADVPVNFSRNPLEEPIPGSSSPTYNPGRASQLPFYGTVILTGGVEGNQPALFRSLDLQCSPPESFGLLSHSRTNHNLPGTTKNSPSEVGSGCGPG